MNYEDILKQENAMQQRNYYTPRREIYQAIKAYMLQHGAQKLLGTEKQQKQEAEATETPSSTKTEQPSAPGCAATPAGLAPITWWLLLVAAPVQRTCASGCGLSYRSWCRMVSQISHMCCPLGWRVRGWVARWLHSTGTPHKNPCERQT